MNDIVPPTTSDLASYESNIHLTLMILLLASGFLLVAFANTLSVQLVTRPDGSSYGWSPDKAREAAATVRCLGAMLFAGGLVERLILHRTPRSRD